jgi:muramoyltetrapeptide carboxypeptidase
MLTSLLLGGHLARAAGIVFGGFTHCDAGSDGRTVDEVLTDVASHLAVPVYAGAPFGHGDDNEAFVIGAPARLHRGAVTMGP